MTLENKNIGISVYEYMSIIQKHIMLYYFIMVRNFYSSTLYVNLSCTA